MVRRYLEKVCLQAASAAQLALRRAGRKHNTGFKFFLLFERQTTTKTFNSFHVARKN